MAAELSLDVKPVLDYGCGLVGWGVWRVSITWMGDYIHVNTERMKMEMRIGMKWDGNGS